MKVVGALSLAGFRHCYRSRAAVTVFIALAVMIVGLVVYFGVRYVFALAGESTIRHMFGLILYSTSLIVLGLNFNAFAGQSLIREKTQRILESVLATPVSVRDVWLSKVLAVLVPGTIISTIVTLAVGLVLALTNPQLGIRSLADPWVLLAGFVWVPLSYLSIAMLAQAIGLGGKPVLAHLIFQIFLPVAANVVIQIGVRFIVLTDSWLFLVINLGVIVGFAVPAAVVAARLTAQKVTLSAGG